MKKSQEDSKIEKMQAALHMLDEGGEAVESGASDDDDDDGYSDLSGAAVRTKR